MISLISLRKEKGTKAKKSRVIRIIQSVTYFIYICILCMIIFTLLFLQFSRKTKSLWRIFRNSQKFRRINPIMLPESVQVRITSPTTQVVFTESRLAERPICVKVWQRQRIKKDVTKQILYLLEGFIYNQRFAPEVYLGIMYLEKLSADAQTFLPGHLTIVPKENKLAHGEYAYLMRALYIDWRLDHRLHSEKEPLATNEGMRFLAKEVARLHRRAGFSFSNSGLSASITDKLKFNLNFFAQALEELSQEGIDVNAYQDISSVMKRAVFGLEPDFRRRFDQGHIKRCHGDLKLTNLWIRPASANFPQKLLALDCIDFNPDFCHIDTLSDVAMLAMDLQMHLLDKLPIHESQDLVEAFISMYLQEAGEDEVNARLLLKYYITEKAMVCGNVSILGDDASERGRKYLSLALQHADELQTLLPLPSGQAISLKEKEIADIAGLTAIH